MYTQNHSVGKSFFEELLPRAPSCKAEERQQSPKKMGILSAEADHIRGNSKPWVQKLKVAKTQVFFMESSLQVI